MIRKIKTKNTQPNLSNTISNDLLLVCSSFVTGLIVPFLIWLWLVKILAETVLAQTI